jgi:hypothetical protein
VAQAKQHAKAKAALLLKENSKNWADKLAGVRAERQQLMTQVQELQQQCRDLTADRVRPAGCGMKGCIACVTSGARSGCTECDDDDDDDARITQQAAPAAPRQRSLPQDSVHLLFDCNSTQYI